jgi:hypothetical protein
MTAAAPTLADLQVWVQNALTASERPTPEALAQQLAGSADFPASAGFGVYRRAYIARIVGAMRAQFPALCHALGRELFDAFTADYVRLYPPESYTLHDLGRRFSAFLEDQRPDRDQPDAQRESWIDFMVDLARFERQLFTIYDAPGIEGFRLPAPDVSDDRLRLQPTLSLGTFRFAVGDYYNAVRRDEKPSVPQQRAYRVALMRKDYNVRMIPLTEWELACLGAMSSGLSFAAAIGAAADATNLPPGAEASFRAELAIVRRRWLAWGFFVENRP